MRLTTDEKRALGKAAMPDDLGLALIAITAEIIEKHPFVFRARPDFQIEIDLTAKEACAIVSFMQSRGALTDAQVQRLADNEPSGPDEPEFDDVAEIFFK